MTEVYRGDHTISRRIAQFRWLKLSERRTLKSRIDIATLLAEITQIDSWQLDGSGVLMANKQSGGVLNVCNSAIHEIEKHTLMTCRHIMINRLPPNTIVPVHTDTVIDNPIRWHLPLVTSKHAFFWDEINGFRFLQVGYWYKIDYTKRHTIGNFGVAERIHLIVDLT